MKESVLDVLIYLFDHYVEQELEIIPNQKDLKSQLNQAGFAAIQFDKAINCLKKAIDINPQYVHAYNNLLFTFNLVD